MSARVRPGRALLTGAAMLLASLAVAAPGAHAAAAGAVPGRLVTPLAANPLAAPVPVKATDGRWHVAYELQLHNWTATPVTIERLRVRALPGGRVVARRGTPRAVAALFETAMFSRPDPRTATIAPGVATIAWMSLSFAARGAVPRALEHELLVRGAGPDGRPERFWMKLGRTTVSRRVPARLGPPLRGAGWVDSNGCCEVSPHTRAVQTFDGVRWLSQRFAIDWIKADAAGRTRGDGDPRDPASYLAYGQDVLAVADGRVVSVLDSRPDRPVPSPDPALDRRNAAHITTGNHVILSIGGGRYPMYAHLQHGSIRVRVGDRVRRGQPIARLGNSGNTTEPHLHFHVADRPRPLEADGLPYVHDRFRLTDRVGGDRRAAFDTPDGWTTRVTLDPLSGGGAWRQDELPLLWDVVDFGG